MNVNVDKTEITWHLQMLSPEELRPKALLSDTQLVRLEIPFPALNRFFYQEVGQLWQWTDRLNWSEEEWRNWVERENVQTWMLHLRGTPAGYFELDDQDGDVEIKQALNTIAISTNYNLSVAHDRHAPVNISEPLLT